MATLNAAAITLCVADLGAFGWGMARFFRTPTGHRPGTALVGLLGLAFTVWHLLTIGAAQPPTLSSAVAIILYLAALALFVGAKVACRQHRPAAIFDLDIPAQIVTRGPYRWVRHPFYLSYLLFWIAGAFASAGAVETVAIIVMTPIYVRAAREEETTMLRSPLTAEYTAYREATGFMLPRWTSGCARGRHLGVRGEGD